MTTVGVALAYLLGCINGGFYLVRTRTGQDLRTLGSGTLGALNTGRVLGRRGFAAALAFDALKGAFAVGLALAFHPPAAAPVAVAVVVGHILPVQLGFRGGKGLATALGAGLVLSPVVAAVAVAVILVTVVLTRKGPPSALAGVVAAPVAALLWHGPGASAVAFAVVAVVVLARHAAPVLLPPTEGGGQGS